MIAYLSGKIAGKYEKTVVVDVNGVGYCVRAARGLIEKIQIGQQAELHIHTHVREDDISLYGFLSREELQFFEMLLSVSGVGPKLALEILNSPMAKVRQAIAKREAAYLTQIPGIGKKTAERIIVDLQGKIEKNFLQDGFNKPVGNEDIVQALISLGYHRQQVLQGLKEVPSEVADAEAIIKYFLQNI